MSRVLSVFQIPLSLLLLPGRQSVNEANHAIRLTTDTIKLPSWNVPLVLSFDSLTNSKSLIIIVYIGGQIHSFYFFRL
jgi:hypothetical protein